MTPTPNPHLCIKYDEKPWGVLPEKLGGAVRHPSWNPYPISEQNLWFSLPYFRPDQKFGTLFQTWALVGVNIKREMVLSLNDEEVASSKKHTQFTYPISDQKG